MMKWFTLTIAILLISVSAQAANLTILITPELDASLVILRKNLNAGRPVPLTMAEYKDYLTSQWVDGLISQANESHRTSVKEAYNAANQTTQDQVKTLLGL